MVWLLGLCLLAVPASAEFGFDEKYERDSNLFNPINQYRPDNPLNPINRVDLGNHANPINRYNPNNPFNPQRIPPPRIRSAPSIAIIPTLRSPVSSPKKWTGQKEKLLVLTSIPIIH